jgi:hypothetical protein
MELFSQLRVAVAEVRGQFWDPQEEERPSLKAITGELMKTQETGKTKCVPQ